MALDFFLYGAGFMAFIFVMCSLYIWWLPVVFLLLSLVLNRVMQQYEAAAPIRDLQDSLRTPIHSHFASTLEGVTSIRAYKAEPGLESAMCQLSDSHAKAALACKDVEGWFNNRIMMLSAAVYSATALGIVMHSVHHNGPFAALYPLSPADSSFILLNLCFASFCLHTGVTRKMELTSLARVRSRLTKVAMPPQTSTVNSEPVELYTQPLALYPPRQHQPKKLTACRFSGPCAADFTKNFTNSHKAFTPTFRIYHQD